MKRFGFALASSRPGDPDPGFPVAVYVVNVVLQVLACLVSCPNVASALDSAVPPVMRLDPADEERILSLACDRISELQVSEILSRAPAPRIFSFQGSLQHDMESFGEFLKRMGYPDEQLRNPRNGSYSYSSTPSSVEVAGALAWYYEHDAMVPMLIGYSGGGVTVNRVLYDLADTQRPPIPVWNPVSNTAEPRFAVRDPVAGANRPVSELRVPYAAMFATGVPWRILLLQWSDIPRLREIPDSVEEFTGFQIVGDLIAGSFNPDKDKYRLLNSTNPRPTIVRNVVLPSDTVHSEAFRMKHLAANEATRAWINNYLPDTHTPPPGGSGIDSSNILQAADIWYSIKNHWCLEVQRVIRSKRRHGAGANK